MEMEIFDKSHPETSSRIQGKKTTQKKLNEKSCATSRNTEEAKRGEGVAQYLGGQAGS